MLLTILCKTLKNFSHQEYNNESYTDTDLYGRSNVVFQRVENETYLPKNFHKLTHIHT